MTTTKYVVGFMFSGALGQVLLIRKNKPEWQRGLLNGIGGKVEECEDIFDAMAREFKEECGIGTEPQDWEHFACMEIPFDNHEINVDCFACIGPIALGKSITDEKVNIIQVCELGAIQAGMIENLPWLIHLAIDVLRDGRPEFVSIFYPNPSSPKEESDE